MLLRTHLTISIFAILVLISSVEGKFLFVVATLIFTAIPDIDSSNSKWGRLKIFRPLQFLAGHRGFFHSYGFLILVSFIFLLLVPKLVLPFFLAYSLHLFADSFTKQGIYLFYPFKAKIRGKVKSGGKVEVSVFVFFLVIDILLFFIKII
jgi:inner membrane protein